jgi:hypothetical protein
MINLIRLPAFSYFEESWYLYYDLYDKINTKRFYSEVSHFFEEVNPKSIYDARMVTKKSNDFNRIVKNLFLFNLLISLDIS